MDLGLSQILKHWARSGDRQSDLAFAFHLANRFLSFRGWFRHNRYRGSLVRWITMLADSLIWIAEKLEVALGQNDKTTSGYLVLKEFKWNHTVMWCLVAMDIHL